MRPVNEWKDALISGAYAQKLAWLYGCPEGDTPRFARRYLHALDGLTAEFGHHEQAELFSAPGRTEIGGNHTDHQHGCVLAGSVSLDMIAAVGDNELGKLRLKSEGYEPFSIDLGNLAKQTGEEQTSTALVRGICAAFAKRGAKLSGLDIYVHSQIPEGSGLSSSAAFEVLIGTILNELLMRANPLPPVEIAQIGQWAENVYFGKPCGLMDQMACSIGGAVGIDFADPAHPVVTPVVLDLADAGLALCILDSGADHAGLTDEYAAVPAECGAVARVCGAKVLRDVPYERFWRNLNACRTQCSDRAVLRAMHFFGDNARVAQQLAAIDRRDYDAFLRLVNESGHSSWEYLQNVTIAGCTQRQQVAVALAVARAALRGKGAVRVHGGGFAGTVQAFVQLNMAEQFRRETEAVLGAGSCRVMTIRPVGGLRLA